MIEKILGNVPDIYEINQTAAKLRQLDMREELQKLAEKYAVPKQNTEAFLSGKRYFLVDGGPIRKTYRTARSKLLDEMAMLKDPHFADVVGAYLIGMCGKSAVEQQILKPHKTLQRCVEYLMEQAWEMVDDEKKNQSIRMGFAVPDDTVYRRNIMLWMIKNNMRRCGKRQRRNSAKQGKKLCERKNLPLINPVQKENPTRRQRKKQYRSPQAHSGIKKKRNLRSRSSCLYLTAMNLRRMGWNKKKIIRILTA